MELESLKYMWKNMEPSGEARDDEALRAMLEKRSHGPVARMQRNLVFELFIMVFTYTPAMLVYILGFGGRFRELAVLLALLLLFFCAYFYRKYTLLQQMQCPACDLRSNLQRQVLKLRQYIRFYTVAGTAIVPVTALLTWLILRWKTPITHGSGLYYEMVSLPWWKTYAFWLPAIAVFTIGVYFVNVCYVNHLYGRHVRKLEELVQEVNEG
jgi:hypothetical protein